jgi:hypothetical protein
MVIYEETGREQVIDWWQNKRKRLQGNHFMSHKKMEVGGRRKEKVAEPGAPSQGKCGRIADRTEAVGQEINQFHLQVWILNKI